MNKLDPPLAVLPGVQATKHKVKPEAWLALKVYRSRSRLRCLYIVLRGKRFISLSSLGLSNSRWRFAWRYLDLNQSRQAASLQNILSRIVTQINITVGRAQSWQQSAITLETSACHHLSLPNPDQHPHCPSPSSSPLPLPPFSAPSPTASAPSSSCLQQAYPSPPTPS